MTTNIFVRDLNITAPNTLDSQIGRLLLMACSSSEHSIGSGHHNGVPSWWRWIPAPWSCESRAHGTDESQIGGGCHGSRRQVVP